MAKTQSTQKYAKRKFEIELKTNFPISIAMIKDCLELYDNLYKVQKVRRLK